MEFIKARTKEERKAYIQGYANAVIDVSEHGIDVASSFVVIMLEADDPEMAKRIREQGDQR